jgi:hypothetical protein
MSAERRDDAEELDNELNSVVPGDIVGLELAFKIVNIGGRLEAFARPKARPT